MTNPGSVRDLIAQLPLLKAAKLRQIELSTKGVFPNDVVYTIDQDNASGNENHFQGVSVLDENHFVVSGSNWRSGEGDVFAFRVEPGGQRGSCITHRALEYPLWHSGGCDSWSDIVVVPAEFPPFGPDSPGRFPGRADPPENPSQPRSTVFFLRGPQLEVLPVRIDRDGILATCAGITQLASGHFAVVVLAAPTGAVQVDYYRSRTTELLDGFDLVWSAADLEVGNYQSITLLADVSGAVFLIGFAGNKKGSVEAFQFAADLPATCLPIAPIDVDVSPADFSAGGAIAAIGGALTLTAVSRYRFLKSKKLVLMQSRVAAPVLAQAQSQPIPLPA